RKKAIECLERALKIALNNDHMETALRAYNNIAVALSSEENQKILEYMEKGFELAKKVGDVKMISFIGTNLAWMYFGIGSLNKAVLMAEESVALDRKAGNMPNLSFSIGTLGSAHQALGEWDKSEQYFKETLSISQKLNRFGAIATSSGYVGWFHFDKGEYVKTREHLEKMYEVWKKAGARYQQISSSRWLTWTYIELGEIEKAKNLVDSLHKFALEVKDKELTATANALRAIQFRAQKKWKESIEYFEKSLQEHEALNARRWNIYWFARMVLCEYARVYLERDQEGDREKAYNLLNEALEIFQKIGAKKEIEKTKSRIVETGQMISEPKPVTEISEVLPDHITTGYGDLDSLLSGGIPRNYAVILTSPSCDERDLIIERFLEAGVKEGQVTFYITTKTSGLKNLVEEFPSNFYLFICNPQADKTIKDASNVFKLKGVENLTDINIALSSAFRKLKSLKGTGRVCIEIVSDILLQHRAVQTRRWLNALIPELRSKGFTTLAVMDPGMHTSQEVRAVLDVFEGEMSIYEKETEKGLEKFLKVKKMTNQKYS
ncbi:tetratricopeptide repeat protein, partial [Candidatus Bathyarchaeota archaeon]|nr:tetratricopeptide repeat protein [Candidatus Bathyarchaeota archaeon]